MMQRFGVYWSIMEGVAVTQKQAAHSIFWLSGLWQRGCLAEMPPLDEPPHQAGEGEACLGRKYGGEQLVFAHRSEHCAEHCE